MSRIELSSARPSDAIDHAHGPGHPGNGTDDEPHPPARGGRVIALILLGLAFLLADLPPLYHSDVWAHVKVGEWIVAHRRLPRAEPLCPFADHGTRYVHFYWLGQVGLALLVRAGAALADGDTVRRIEGGSSCSAPGTGCWSCSASWRCWRRSGGSAARSPWPARGWSLP